MLLVIFFFHQQLAEKPGNLWDIIG